MKLIAVAMNADDIRLVKPGAIVEYPDRQFPVILGEVEIKQIKRRVTKTGQVNNRRITPDGVYYEYYTPSGTYASSIKFTYDIDE